MDTESDIQKIYIEESKAEHKAAPLKPNKIQTPNKSAKKEKAIDELKSKKKRKKTQQTNRARKLTKKQQQDLNVQNEIDGLRSSIEILKTIIKPKDIEYQQFGGHPVNTFQPAPRINIGIPIRKQHILF
jgi:hypothetical protein